MIWIETWHRISFVTPNNLWLYSTFSPKNNDKEQPPSKFIIQELKTHMPHTLQWFLNEMVSEDLCSKSLQPVFKISSWQNSLKYGLGETNWTKTSVKTLRFGTNIFFRLKTPKATEGMICHLRCNDALEGPGCGSRHWCWGEPVDGWKQTKESINVASNKISHKKYQLFRMYFEWMIPHQHLDGYICDMQNHWDSPIFTATQSIFLSKIQPL